MSKKNKNKIKNYFELLNVSAVNGNCIQLFLTSIPLFHAQRTQKKMPHDPRACVRPRQALLQPAEQLIFPNEFSLFQLKNEKHYSSNTSKR